ncbi:MAG TPA: hypothetical protein VFQ79_01735 [Bryobacteraceae bacterium]|nr:hypothetical protein [Bryobacteraceae bacterium]
MKGKILFGVLALSFVSMVSAQQNIFTNIGVLQKAAVPILSSVGWKDLGSGVGFYGSSQIELPTSGFVPSTVRYSISGKTGNRADQALISAFIASPRDLSAGRAKVEAAATQWFKSVGKPVPAGLIAAIKTGKPFQSTAGGLSLQYVVERGMGSPIKQPDGTSYRCTTMDLTIKPL